MVGVYAFAGRAGALSELPMPDAITRTCRSCGRNFTFAPEELVLFARLAAEHPEHEWSLPRLCTGCRAQRRAAREIVQADDGDVVLRCITCGQAFAFRSRDRAYYAERQFRLPRRCPRCRERAHG